MVDDNTKKSRSRMWKTGVIKIRERERKVDFYFRSQKRKRRYTFVLTPLGLLKTLEEVPGEPERTKTNGVLEISCGNLVSSCGFVVFEFCCSC
jgi:hypothetical protein